jgi:hypothetical protein
LNFEENTLDVTNEYQETESQETEDQEEIINIEEVDNDTIVLS